MLSTVLIISAYTALTAIVIFLAVYSSMYNWWKNPMGRVMNLSLIANGIVASGVAFRMFEEPMPGRILSSIGWILFTIAIVLRLRLLVATHKATTAELNARIKEESQMDHH